MARMKKGKKSLREKLSPLLACEKYKRTGWTVGGAAELSWNHEIGFQF